MIRLPFTSLVLVTLGKRLGRRPRPFTVAELQAWAPELRGIRTAHSACGLLARVGLLEAAPREQGDTRANQVPSRPAQWQLTAAGKEAAHTAQLEAAARKHGQTLAEFNLARTLPNSLPQRLWTLLRARRALTSLEAVELLGDAGANVDQLRAQVGKYLSAWHTLLPDTIQVSARRIGNCRRFVLIGDVGRLPPKELRNAERRARGKRLERAA